MTFASDTSILRDPNVFIADIVTTTDITPFLDGLTNFDKAIKKYSFTDAYLYVTKVNESKCGTLKGVICDYHRKALHNVAIG